MSIVLQFVIALLITILSFTAYFMLRHLEKHNNFKK